MVLLVISLGACLLWSFFLQQRITERRALAEAQVLSYEMRAIWDYVNDIQNRINYDSDGLYNFKGIYCTIAAKNIAQRFMRETDYAIRYVRENPRSFVGEPDAFELKAFEEIRRTGTTEYHAVAEYKGQRALRYVEALYIQGNCLECHGEPAGESDLIGYAKEGMRFGDIGGAVSIIIPLDTHEGESAADIVESILFFTTGIFGVIVVMRLALRRWVFSPLGKLERAVTEIGAGNLEMDQDLLCSSDEIGELSKEFNLMANKLKSVYDTLETQVDERTSQLAQANAVLCEQRRQIEDTNESLKIANAKLLEESASKSNFLAIMNHELKTPLAAIVSVTEIWEKTTPKKSAEELRLIREIRMNCQTLLNTIENTIDMARLEAGRFEMIEDEVDLVDVVNEAVDLILPLAVKRKIALSSHVDPKVPVIKSGWDALHKILINLVSNAVKFTDIDGEVSILVVFNEERKEVTIQVSDTGIGISEEDISRIFDRFVQSDSSNSRRYGGSGLGLSLVRELAEMLGGRVEVKSSIGKGSQFYVVLPIKENLS
jgi:signal transduction histidine kinase